MINKDIIQRLVAREGGFVNHPYDRGGPTKYGITLVTLSNYRDKDVTIEDVRNLELDEAINIYNDLYWVKSRFTTLDINSHIAEFLFDSAIHHGVYRATIFLQRSVNVTEDGIIGPITRNAVINTNKRELLINLLQQRIKFFGSIVVRDSSQLVFLHGWLNRMDEFFDMLR